MKTVTIGDIHGHDTWKKVDPAQYDKIIFVGDYLDSFSVDNETMGNNLLDIIQFKKDYPDKVVLLLGNHDIHYLFDDMRYRGSGYRAEFYLTFYDILHPNNNLFQIAYQVDNVLWTHAGVSKKWADEYLTHWHKSMYAEALNDKFQTKKGRDEIMLVGHMRGGYNLYGGPVWADHKESIRHPIAGLVQIFGHTNINELSIIKGENYELINTDCLGADQTFYEREITSETF